MTAASLSRSLRSARGCQASSTRAFRSDSERFSSLRSKVVGSARRVAMPAAWQRSTGSRPAGVLPIASRTADGTRISLMLPQSSARDMSAEMMSATSSSSDAYPTPRATSAEEKRPADANAHDASSTASSATVESDMALMVLDAVLALNAKSANDFGTGRSKSGRECIRDAIASSSRPRRSSARLLGTGMSRRYAPSRGYASTPRNRSKGWPIRTTPSMRLRSGLTKSGWTR